MSRILSLTHLQSTYQSIIERPLPHYTHIHPQRQNPSHSPFTSVLASNWSHAVVSSSVIDDMLLQFPIRPKPFVLGLVMTFAGAPVSTAPWRQWWTCSNSLVPWRPWTTPSVCSGGYACTTSSANSGCSATRHSSWPPRERRVSCSPGSGLLICVLVCTCVCVRMYVRVCSYVYIYAPIRASMRACVPGNMWVSEREKKIVDCDVERAERSHCSERHLFEKRNLWLVIL